jgi:glyoxylase-like metal-dependent hydrolase (beta-lactamase superfamily II)
MEKTNALAFVCGREALKGAESFEVGQSFRLGNLSIETRLTSGHAVGGITYVIRGLAHPVAVVGDALFAGSMGGAAHAYTEALRNNREQILTLPEETVLCPGHGPLTTVGEQKFANPFFAL